VAGAFAEKHGKLQKALTPVAGAFAENTGNCTVSLRELRAGSSL